MGTQGHTMGRLPRRSFALFHLDDLIGDQTVRPTMDLSGCRGVRRFDEAEYFARALVEPVVEILHIERFLRRKVCFMRALDSLSCQPIHVMMDVHVEGHSHVVLSVR